MNRLLLLLAVLTILPAATKAQEPQAVTVQFEPGYESAIVAGKVTGDESVIYELNARAGQFLSVSLRPDNQSANFNVYLPGRGPGDEALFSSATGGVEYTGQLYRDGIHRIPVFLVRAAARRGETANYDIAFRITNEKPGGPIPAEIGPAVAMERPDSPPAGTASQDHGPLLERQATLPLSIATSPVTIAVAVLTPDLTGQMTSVATSYDTMENPAEVNVTITERGILDDDLLGIEHTVSLARNSNNQWRVIAYQRAEMRR